MNILWSIHLYPPIHNCGSEYVAHFVNKYLISKGHQVRVILHQAKMHNIATPYEFDGVEVIGATGYVDAYRWADIILTHLDFTQFTILMADEAKRPIVHFVHNDIPYTSILASPRNAKTYVVYNSKWIRSSINYPHPSFVLYPPCDPDYYNVCEDPSQNEYITMISINKNKGGELLYRVAEAMPEKKFLGVIGSYDEQIIRYDIPNVTLVPNNPDILSVYRKTRVLLMPSAYESWGRTATEAMCSGIPVICTPTPGLKENCQDAAIYVPVRFYDHDIKITDGQTYDINPIVKAIRRLNNKKFYQQMSERGRARAEELRPDLSKIEDFLIHAAKGIPCSIEV